MPSGIEIRLAVLGLLSLAKFKPDFLRFFDQSPRGALRSFWLILPIYPYFLLLLWNSGAIGTVADPTQFILAMSLCYLYFWLLPPAILTWIAPLIGREAEMPGCIAIYNWLSLLNVAVSLPLLLLSIAGIASNILAVPDDILLVASVAWEAFLLLWALRLALWQAALASVADYLVMHYIVVPIFVSIGGVA